MFLQLLFCTAGVGLFLYCVCAVYDGLRQWRDERIAERALKAEARRLATKNCREAMCKIEREKLAEKLAEERAKAEQLQAAPVPKIIVLMTSKREVGRVPAHLN